MGRKTMGKWNTKARDARTSEDEIEKQQKSTLKRLLKRGTQWDGTMTQTNKRHAKIYYGSGTNRT
jgi:hypothetical protein